MQCSEVGSENGAGSGGRADHPSSIASFCPHSTRHSAWPQEELSKCLLRGEWKDLCSKGAFGHMAGAPRALKDQLCGAAAGKSSIQNSLSSGQWPAGPQPAVYKG